MLNSSRTGVPAAYGGGVRCRAKCAAVIEETGFPGRVEAQMQVSRL
jgi:hypothetical protein